MASFTLTQPQVFPVGTSVGAYNRSDWQPQTAPAGAPPGAAVNSQTVAANGTLTFTGLADNASYVAGASVSGTWRYVNFGAQLPKALGANDSRLSDSRRNRVSEVWRRTGAIAETQSRTMRQGTTTPLVSGRLSVFGGIVLPANQVITSITFRSSTTAVGTPTNQWAALLDINLGVLRKSTDVTTAAWAASTEKTFTLATTYTPTAEEPVYVALMVAATTVPNLMGFDTIDGAGSLAAPAIAGNANTGLTTPASLTTVSALSAASGLAYAYVS